MKVMISQPMKDLSDEQIEEVRNRAIKAIEARGDEFVSTFFKDDWNTLVKKLNAEGVTNISLHFLSRSLMEMSKCDGVYFCKGWESARGCVVEHQVAKSYGLYLFYEEDEEKREAKNA